MPFELVLDGHTYNTDHLRLDDAVALEKTLEKKWTELNPLASAAEFQAFALVCLKQDHPADVAAKIVADLSLGAALAAAKWVKDDLPDVYEDGHPKAGGGSSTTTSSGAPDDTDGLPT